MFLMPNTMVLHNISKILLIFCMISIGTSRDIKISNGGNMVNVMDHGAVGDGKTDDTKAFMDAWKIVCANGLTLYIPETKIFFLNPINFEGPCTSNVNVKVSGEIIAPDKSKWSGDLNNWLSFIGINSLTVDGDGTINGNGINWWKETEGTKPTAVGFTHCNNLKLIGVRHKDSQRNHISLSACENVLISGIHISAPEESPNTDGIDMSNCNGVNIENIFIGTGDDCIAINGGTSNVNITSVQCGPGHGISIGSLGKGGNNEVVENINVKDSSFKGTQNGVRIKTWQGGNGYARKISFHNITFTNADNPVIIDQYYCPHDQCPKISPGSAVKISDVSYTELRGTSACKEAINLNCDEHFGCANISFGHVNITGAQSTIATCQNVQGTFIDTFPQLHCLKSAV